MNAAMEKLALSFGAAVLFVGAAIVLIPLATAFGALAGWIVGWFFGETILHVLSEFGLRNVAMWQLGAFLGFVSGFLRTRTECKTKAPDA